MFTISPDTGQIKYCEVYCWREGKCQSYC